MHYCLAVSTPLGLKTLPQYKGERLVSKVFSALLRVPNFLVFAKASEAGNLTSVAIDPVTPLGWSINHILGYLAEFYLYSTVIPLTPLDLLEHPPFLKAYHLDL